MPSMSFYSAHQYCAMKFAAQPHPCNMEPGEVPVCSKCESDLLNHKRNGTNMRKFECSSPHCFWHDWFEPRRPKGWHEHYRKCRNRERREEWQQRQQRHK